MREGYDWTTYIDLSMLVPICASCKTSADVQFGEHNLPEVLIENWQEQYEKLGIDKDNISEIEREIRVNSWKGLFCFKCLKKILLKDSNKNFYIFSTPLTDYYGCKESPGRSFADWMKPLAFEEFGNKCKSCEQVFPLEDLTSDHILPWDLGGKSEFSNLQLLCQPCNNKKANSPSKIVISHITAELFPPDLDASLESQDKRIGFLGDDFSHPLASSFMKGISAKDWDRARKRGTVSPKIFVIAGFLLA